MIDLFGFNTPSEEDEVYTKKVDIPQYLPSRESPKLYECFDDKKYRELIGRINESSVSDEEKQFLKLCATRHLVFKYNKIADYYAHASKEMQELMEDSAIVIIDIDDAIAGGYVNLSNNIKDLIKKDRETNNW